MKRRLINGSVFSDSRGELRAFNKFNMNEVVRFYEIAPASIENIRGWIGHRAERKWFCCSQGAFIINVVELDSFDTPSKTLDVFAYRLDSSEAVILQAGPGVATAIRAESAGSRLTVYSNFSLEESQADDYRFPEDYWAFKNKA